VGRALDLADGWAADKTGTKSRLGEAVDASLDKIETVIVLLAVWPYVAPWIVPAILVPHGLIAIVALSARELGRPLHPLRSGKVSMALAWVGLVVIVLAPYLISWLSVGWVLTVGLVGAVLVLASAVLGVVALVKYARQTFAPKSAHP
jgi:phosphatidylglycerophosphate synthase